MFKINSTTRLKATEVQATEKDIFDKKLAMSPLGKKCLEAAEKAKKQNDRSFEVVLDTIKFSVVPTEQQLKQAGAHLAYGTPEENGTKEAKVTWTYADGVPGVYFSGKNAKGEDQDLSTNVIEPLGATLEGWAYGDEMIKYVKAMEKMISKLKHLK